MSKMKPWRYVKNCLLFGKKYAILVERLEIEAHKVIKKYESGGYD